MDEFDLHADRTNICSTTMEAEGEGWDSMKLALVPQVIHYWPFRGGTFIVVSVLQCFTYTLRKHAYSNIQKISSPKIENFQVKNSDIFNIPG